MIRLTVMRYVRFPLPLRQVENLLSERGIDICHETVRYWWNRFGPMFAREIRNRRVQHRSYSRWRWYLDEVFVRINGETHYLWRAVDPEGEMPSPLGKALMMLNALLPYLSGKDGTGPVPPEPHGFMANIDATLEQNTFRLPKRQWIADVNHSHEADHDG